MGGKPCKTKQAGHVLQIFIKRDLVDELSYPALPYGPLDDSRMPMASWMNGDHSFSVGQARIVVHPMYFMQASCVRMHVASADPTFHHNRRRFQEELIDMLRGILGEPSLRQKAAKG